MKQVLYIECCSGRKMNQGSDWCGKRKFATPETMSNIHFFFICSAIFLFCSRANSQKHLGTMCHSSIMVTWDLIKSENNPIFANFITLHKIVHMKSHPKYALHSCWKCVTTWAAFSFSYQNQLPFATMNSENNAWN